MSFDFLTNSNDKMNLSNGFSYAQVYYFSIGWSDGPSSYAKLQGPYVRYNTVHGGRTSRVRAGDIRTRQHGLLPGIHSHVLTRSDWG